LTDEQQAEALKQAVIARDSIIELYKMCEELIEALKREHEKIRVITNEKHYPNADCPVCQLIKRIEG